MVSNTPSVLRIIHSLHIFQQTVAAPFTEVLIHALQTASIEPIVTNSYSLSHSLTMFFSMARLSLTAAALVLPIYVQAVAFTVDSFKDIAVGKAKNLTWSGDGHVRYPTLFHSPNHVTDVNDALSQSP